MTLVERYLRAVRDQLPRGQQDDIINELSDSIHSRIEDEEAALGRPLAEAEEVALLKGVGHPMAVAARYRGDERSLTFGRQLIGPELFPTYLTILAINVAVTLTIGAITAVASGSLWSGISAMLPPFAIQFPVVTLIFIFVDRRWVRDPDGWDPRSVSSMGPDVDLSSLDGIAAQLIGKQHTQAVAITSSVLEIGLLGAALTAWVAIGMPERIGFMAPGAGWRDLYTVITVAIVAALLIPVVTLVRPTWTRFRVAGHVVFDTATIVIGAVSLALGSWVVLADPASAPADADDLVGLINGVIRVSIAATIVLTAISLALEIRRFIRMSRSQEGA
jgi:hypothetical protein